MRQVAAAELRPGKSARRHDQRAGPEFAAANGDGEQAVRAAFDPPHLRAGFDVDARVRALGQQEVDDLAGRAVAEKLAKLFFVVGNAVALDEGDDVQAVWRAVCTATEVEASDR